MSNIAIYIDGELGAKELLSIKKLSGKAPSDVKACLKNGGALFERELFDGKYNETATMLRGIIYMLTKADIPFRVYEFPEGKTMVTCDFVDKCLITSDILLKILDQSDSEFERQIFTQDSTE